MAACLVPDFPAVRIALEHLGELGKKLYYMHERFHTITSGKYFTFTDFNMKPSIYELLTSNLACVWSDKFFDTLQINDWGKKAFHLVKKLVTTWERQLTLLKSWYFQEFIFIYLFIFYYNHKIHCGLQKKGVNIQDI